MPYHNDQDDSNKGVDIKPSLFSTASTADLGLMLRAYAKNQMVWKKVDRDLESDTFDAVADLDTRCFVGLDSERMTPTTKIYGDIYTLSEKGQMVGYAVYGQVWLPDYDEGYITRIGVDPAHRKLGYGLKMLETITADLAARTTPKCQYIFADIRKSNIASQNLFRKAGFEIYGEFDSPYPDETGIRVMKALSRCRHDSND